MVKIKINTLLLNKSKSAFEITWNDVKDDYHEAVGGDIQNGKAFFVWSKRLNAWIKIVSREFSTYSQISIDRVIWETVAVLDDEGILWLLTSRKNFYKVQDDIKRGKVTHYMYLLTSNNPDYAEQLAFDGLSKNDYFQKQRLEQAKKILGDDFSKIVQTQIIVFDYTSNLALNGSIILVDNQFNVLEEQSISNSVFLPQTSNDEVSALEFDDENQDTDREDILVSWKNPDKDNPNDNNSIKKETESN